MFVWPDGRPYHPSYISKRSKILVEKAGLNGMRLHDFRHGIATALLSAGRNMKEIQAWLRHADIGTTMNIYAHVEKRLMDDIGDTAKGLINVGK